MTNTDLKVIAPTRKHLPELVDLSAKVFSGSGYYRMRDHCLKGYLKDSHYDWNVSRIGIADGRIITHFGVWDFQMRVGLADLRTAGVGLVATDNDYRNRGLLSKTARPSIAAMLQAGYDISLLYGKENLYHRYNYVRSWADVSYIIQTADLPDKKVAGIKRFKLVYDQRRADLYNRWHAGLSGTAVRPTYPLAGSPLDFQGYQWMDARGGLAGYVVVMPDKGNAARLICIDSAGEPTEILRAVGQLARKLNCNNVRFKSMHERSRLAGIIRRGNVFVEQNYRRNGGPMARTINLKSCLTKIAPELSRRLEDSALADLAGRLGLSDGMDKVTLDIAKGHVTVSDADAGTNTIIANDAAVQFLLGTADAAEIIESNNIETTSQAKQLAKVLFPAQQPILSGWDFF
ncbi:MAG: GNAT family N-acetyltransferase [Planctomycetaceae bacterium]|nr:MAG: GNAT family N-acetyltransferase [Planctomycetaceae bacterium]